MRKDLAGWCSGVFMGTFLLALFISLPTGAVAQAKTLSPFNQSPQAQDLIQNVKDI